MKNTFSFIMGILVIVLIAGAGYFYFGKSPIEEPSLGINTETQEEVSQNMGETTNIGITTTDPKTDTNTRTEIETTPTPTTETRIPKTLAVTYTDSGFTPNTLEIHVGDSVTFAKEGLKVMWVASAPHPVHTDFPAFDQKKTGDSYTFTFTKIGTFKYHNHVAPGNNGIITVK